MCSYEGSHLCGQVSREISGMQRIGFGLWGLGFVPMGKHLVFSLDASSDFYFIFRVDGK